MTRILSLLALSAVLFVCTLASSAQAQVTRTFVSGTGSDSNPCTYTQPCRYFTSAISALPAGGGEVDVLDPGSYGQITITNSVSIVGRGWTTITSTSSTAAIAITGSGTVNISGVQLDGGGSGKYGINYTGSGVLHVQDSVIRNFSNGILFQPNDSSQFSVSNTLVSDNGADGINVNAPSSGTTNIVFTHVEMENNVSNGLNVQSNGQIIYTTVSDSVIANSAGNGILISGGGATINIMVRNSTIANNYTAGLAAYASTGNSTIRVTRSTITGNGSGWSVTGVGVVTSYNDNNIDDNISNNDGPPTTGYK